MPKAASRKKRLKKAFNRFFLRNIKKIKGKK
jgi:hypothetical protein